MSREPEITWPERVPSVDPFPPDLRDALRMLVSVLRHCFVLASYEVRPFDMLADRRRWRWQRRHPCQFTDGAPAVLRHWRLRRPPDSGAERTI